MTSRSRNWSIEEEFDSDYSYPKLPRYSNVNTSYYMTPQRYVGSVSDTYSPTVRQSTRMVNLPTVTSHLHGKSYTRAIPAIAHQRLSGTSLPPRSYVSTYDSDDKLLGYRVPPSNHVITATTYRPWPEEEIEYYQPRVYTDSWAHTITPPNRIRWRSYIDDDDYTVEDPVFVRSGSQYKNTPLPRANFSYADRYANDIYNDSTSIVPSSYYLGHKSHVPVHVNKGYHYMMPKYKSIDPRDYYEDSSHARKYVVVPMRDVHSDIYNMSFYRKPMEAANIGYTKPRATWRSGSAEPTELEKIELKTKLINLGGYKYKEDKQEDDKQDDKSLANKQDDDKPMANKQDDNKPMVYKQEDDKVMANKQQDDKPMTNKQEDDKPIDIKQADNQSNKEDTSKPVQINVEAAAE